jgi:hypothetical protein
MKVKPVPMPAKSDMKNGPMPTRDAMVAPKGGKAEVALEAYCEECGNNTFRILIIHGHNHLNCSNCNTSFCQNGCCG